jgi:hypothetical protein
LERRMMGACHGRFLRTGSNTVLDLVVFSSHLWRHVGAGGFGVRWRVHAAASCWIVFVLSSSHCASSSVFIGLLWLLCLLLGLGVLRVGWPLCAAVRCRSATFFTGHGHLGMRFSIKLPLFFSFYVCRSWTHVAR